MDEDWLIARVRSRTGGRGRECRRAAVAVVQLLSGALEPAGRRGLAEALPASLAGMVDAAKRAQDLDLDALYLDVSRRARLSPSQAIEAAQAVLETLAEGLPDEVVTLLRKELPAPIADRVARREGAPEPPPHAHVHPPWKYVRPPTLSTGRPGPAAPISEARPGAPQRGSVAASDDPHGDTKLSSAHGTTQEQDDRTLSESTAQRR